MFLNAACRAAFCNEFISSRTPSRFFGAWRLASNTMASWWVADFWWRFNASRTIHVQGTSTQVALPTDERWGRRWCLMHRVQSIPKIDQSSLRTFFPVSNTSDKIRAKFKVHCSRSNCALQRMNSKESLIKPTQVRFPPVENSILSDCLANFE